MNPPLHVITVRIQIDSIILGYIKYIHFEQIPSVDGKSG